MLPSFLATNGASAGTVVQVPPPPNFVPVEGAIHYAELENITTLSRGSTPSQKNGLRYEGKILRALNIAYGYDFKASPHLRFKDEGEGGYKRAIPDGFLHIGGALIVVEIKYQHVPESWWQLRKKYEPIAKWLYPEMKVQLLEICHTYDPTTPYPERVELIEEIAEWANKSPPSCLGVKKWKL